jgi:hypothetical protein
MTLSKLATPMFLLSSLCAGCVVDLDNGNDDKEAEDAPDAPAVPRPSTTLAGNGNCPPNQGHYSVAVDVGLEGNGFQPNKYVSGWVFDHNDPGRSVGLWLFTYSSSDDDDCSQPIANQSRDDVNAYCGVTGAHGFSFVIPSYCNLGSIILLADDFSPLVDSRH